MIKIPLRSTKHVDVLRAALGEQATINDTSDGKSELAVRAGAEQATLEAVCAAIPKAAIYDSRLLTFTYVDLRRAFPDLPEVRSGRIAKVVTGLNAAGVEWSTTMKLDGTIRWTVAGAEGVDLKALAASYAPDAKPATRTKKAPRAKAAGDRKRTAPKAGKPSPRAMAEHAAAGEVAAAKELVDQRRGRKPRGEVTPIPKAPRKARAPRTTRKAS